MENFFLGVLILFVFFAQKINRKTQKKTSKNSYYNYKTKMMKKK